MKKESKAYLNIYLNNNLGDDIFAKIISERYSNTKFYTFLRNDLKYNFKNIKIYNGKFYRVLNKVLTKISNNKMSISKILAKKYPIGVVIGGSMFIQGKSGKKEELNYTKEAFVLGSNFGPYYDEEYLNYFKELFKKCKCVSFRDEYSYNLFRDIGDNIQLAPDIAFSLDTKNIDIKNSKKVIFSIIDCKTMIDEKYQDEYDDLIIQLTKYFIKKGYETKYMSFCTSEGDKEAIDRILSKIKLENSTIYSQISTYDYNGNIDEAINVLADSEIIVGSRFHANILGMLLNKVIIPIKYSNKITNVLKDMDFKGKIIDIRNIQDFSIEDLNEENLKYKIDITKYVNEAEQHFKKLDEILL